MASGSNRKAVDDTLASLREAGHLDGGHQALIQLACSLADAVDAEPANASLWREYRGAIGDLAKLDSGNADAFSDLVSRLRTPLGDTAN